MKQYVIIARDGQDPDALARRMAVRGVHLDGAAKLKANNNFVVGGAMLNNETNQMEGSVMIVQFETEEDFNDWYNNEPYIKAGVWQDIEVRPFRVASV